MAATRPLDREMPETGMPFGVELLGPAVGDAARVLTSGAAAFVAMLHRRFESRRASLLEREELQDFLTVPAYEELTRNE
jgi:malate synthase